MWARAEDMESQEWKWRNKITYLSFLKVKISDFSYKVHTLPAELLYFSCNWETLYEALGVMIEFLFHLTAVSF